MTALCHRMRPFTYLLHCPTLATYLLIYCRPHTLNSIQGHQIWVPLFTDSPGGSTCCASLRDGSATYSTFSLWCTLYTEYVLWTNAIVNNDFIREYVCWTTFVSALCRWTIVVLIKQHPLLACVISRQHLHSLSVGITMQFVHVHLNM